MMSILDMNFWSFMGFKKRPKAPWSKYYDDKHMNININNESIYEFLKRHCVKFKNNVAIEYFGTKITYARFLEEIDKCAKAFKRQGVRQGDIVSIISANIPEALYAFYGLNKIGAVVNFLHPLLSQNEIKDALVKYSSVIVVAMDITYSKLKNIVDDTLVYKTIIVSAKDSMPFLTKLGYEITRGHKVETPKSDKDFIFWKEFMLDCKVNDSDKYEVSVKKDTPAVILQSGGSTGTPKGIVLSNGNFNASSMQAKIALPDLDDSDVCLGIMPIFHGFGLQVSINDAFCVGAKVVLIPEFKAGEFDKLIKKYEPTVLIGVPTLFEALTNNEGMKYVKLEKLKYVITGGDTLNKKRVEKINDFLHEHGAKTNFTQGYGMTEAVAAITFDLKNASKPGSVGIPWPGTYVKIVKPMTDEELKPDEDGEICISGPTVMLGYYDNEKETNDALRIHKDGNLWLHSGDIGSMDKDGYVTYKQRLKRMIVTSGYNVYPSRIEEVLEKHPAILDASVIGIPHKYKVEVAKAYIVLKKGYRKTVELEKEIMDLCKENLAHYSIPKEFEYRKSLPKTIIGKVDFRKLQLENNKKREEENEKQN